MCMFGYLFFGHGSWSIPAKEGHLQNYIEKKTDSTSFSFLLVKWVCKLTFKHFQQLNLICRFHTIFIKNPKKTTFLFLTGAVNHKLRWKQVHLICNQSNSVHLICTIRVYKSLALPTFLVCLASAVPLVDLLLVYRFGNFLTPFNFHFKG